MSLVLVFSPRSIKIRLFVFIDRHLKSSKVYLRSFESYFFFYRFAACGVDLFSLLSYIGLCRDLFDTFGLVFICSVASLHFNLVFGIFALFVNLVHFDGLEIYSSLQILDFLFNNINTPLHWGGSSPTVCLEIPSNSCSLFKNIIVFHRHLGFFLAGWTLLVDYS